MARHLYPLKSQKLQQPCVIFCVKNTKTIIVIELKWSAGSLSNMSSDSSRALTNQKASLPTSHDSSKYGGTVIGGRASGQEAKDRWASTCADAWGKYIFHEYITALKHWSRNLELWRGCTSLLCYVISFLIIFLKYTRLQFKCYTVSPQGKVSKHQWAEIWGFVAAIGNLFTLKKTVSNCFQAIGYFSDGQPHILMFLLFMIFFKEQLQRSSAMTSVFYWLATCNMNNRSLCHFVQTHLPPVGLTVRATWRSP